MGFPPANSGSCRLSRLRWGKVLPVLLLAALTLPACAPPNSQAAPTSTLLENRAWSYADLRQIDPIDARSAEQDLLAAYLRKRSERASTWWELRLDFLSMAMHSTQDIYIALDYSPGGKQGLPFLPGALLSWEALIHIPASGEVSAYDAQGKPIADLSLLVQRDPAQATLQVSLDGAALYAMPGSGAPPEITAQVFILDPVSRQLADLSDPLRSSAAPPPPARVLLAFNNTYPAYTPAQALRRWDGAHTGPLGGRHGLGDLLRLARNHAAPITLLDLRFPAWLSALDYAGDMDQVETMADSGMLIIPEYLPEPGSVEGLPAYLEDLARRFDLPGSQFAYAQFMPSFSSGEKLLFLPTRSDFPLSAIYQQGDRRILPVPLPAASQPTLQPTLDGLPVAALTRLVDVALQAAAQPDSAAFLVLGGDLTTSSWGYPEAARAAFSYINSHPWIQLLNAYDLLSLPASQATLDFQPYYPDSSALTASLPWDPMLAGAQDDTLLAAALQAALALTPPAIPTHPQFAALQEIYAPQVNILLAASHWAQHPQPAASCDMDLDLDNAPECLLASENLFLVFEPELGALTHAFYLAADGAHQLIAPSSQFTFGTSDPAAWDLSAGLAADPQVIPGAFYDGDGVYQARISTGQLVLSNPASGTVKTFTLLPDGLRVDYQAPSSLVARLPLALDPWQRFEPGWGKLYQGETIEDAWFWGIAQGLDQQQGLRLHMTTSGRMQASAFNDTQARMGGVEDPNTEYPAGHYLPFPMAMAEITGRGEFWVELQVNSE
jgi:hypothetical protein